MRKVRMWAFISIGFACLAGVISSHGVWAALSTATDAKVDVTRTGNTTIYWPWAAAADGTDSVHVTKRVHGLLDAAYFGNTGIATEVVDNSAILTLSIKEVISYAGLDQLIDTSIRDVTAILPPKATHIWPTYTIPVSEELQLDISGCLTATGGPAKGIVILTLTPNVAHGD